MDKYISLGALIVSVVALVYTYLSNTKKYELYNQYKNEILAWYKETNEILFRLQTEATSNFNNLELKKDLLSKLSANIDYGRFFFPNLDNNYKGEKLIAYKGLRNNVLDCLVFTYSLYSKDDYQKHLNHAKYFRKKYTSLIFQIINPKNFIKETKKITGTNFYINKSYDDFLSEEFEIISKYI